MVCDDDWSARVRVSVFTFLMSLTSTENAHCLEQLSTIQHELDILLARIARISPQDSSSGLSVLDVRNHTLLSYITHLAALILYKTSGKSIAPVAEAVVGDRVVLEKTGPLVHKLQYQISKLVQQNATTSLQHRANPLALAADRESNGIEASGQLAEIEKQVDYSAKEVYKPPRVAPVHYDPTDIVRKGRLSKRQQQQASQSRMLKDLRSELGTLPEQVDSGGTGHAHMRSQEELDLVEFEEHNFVRKTVGKAHMRNMARKQLLANELQDLQTDFAGLRGMEELVPLAKRARVDNAEHEIQKASRQSKSKSQDLYSVNKRILKKRK